MITTKKILKDTQLFLDSIVDGVFIVDKKGIIRQTNNGATEILDRPIDKLIGQFVLEPLGAVDDQGKPVNKANSNLFKSIIDGKKINNAIRQFTKRNGDKIWVSTSTTPIIKKSGKINGGIIIFRDITEQKIKDDYWSDFAHIASHNLRSPLGNVLWAAESMIAGEIGKFTAEQTDFIEDMYITLKDMNRLVNDLLGVSRLHNKQIRPKRAKVSIEKIANKVIKNTQYYADAQNIKIKLTSGNKKNNYVKVDEGHLQTVIQNLVENAIRYSSPKTTVELSIKPHENKYIIFSCKNEGIGIPKDRQKFIFSKFFRAKNAVNKIGSGTGLGLYITHEMVRANKGEIWFTSELNSTTVFNVKLNKY
jgi:PAS domain S-box-containing protein